ncbi:Chromate resistance protein ChrB [Streptomyces hydrogenans]|uniref:Chromate resistance protein ChrB n=1 Tax=Streptomyces hydrogenans TaxID=1873719 RepID=UPI0038261A44
MGSSGRSGPGDGSAGRVLAALPGGGRPVRLPDAVLTPTPATLDAFVTREAGRGTAGRSRGWGRPEAARAVRPGGSSGRRQAPRTDIATNPLSCLVFASLRTRRPYRGRPLRKREHRRAVAPPPEAAAPPLRRCRDRHGGRRRRPLHPAGDGRPAARPHQEGRPGAGGPAVRGGDAGDGEVQRRQGAGRRAAPAGRPPPGRGGAQAGRAQRTPRPDRPAGGGSVPRGRPRSGPPALPLVRPRRVPGARHGPRPGRRPADGGAPAVPRRAADAAATARRGVGAAARPRSRPAGAGHAQGRDTGEAARGAAAAQHPVGEGAGPDRRGGAAGEPGERAGGAGERAERLRAGGEAIRLDATGRGPEDADRFAALFTAAREEDWTEFLADCGKFEEEIAKEIRTAKFTLAELEEEEQSLERLRRRHRDLTARDVFGAPLSGPAGERLAHCVTVCERYAELVFDALHRPGGEER